MTSADLSEGICSIDLLEPTSECPGRGLAAPPIIEEAATVTATSRDSGKRTGARLDQINRMASASEQDGLKRTSRL